MKKLGHQAPKGYVVDKFNRIQLEGDFAYCKSHNFVYDTSVEQYKLYNALPCYYTDARYKNSKDNYYHHTNLYWERWKEISTKSCIRRVNKCRNIPVGTIVRFFKGWGFISKKIDNSYLYKVTKLNEFDPDYEISEPSYFKNFTTCEFSKQLTDKLRENGFIVRVDNNESTLLNIVNSATTHTGSDNLIDSRINGETAIAYGYGKKIGFSSHNDEFLGYTNGCNNILWDKLGWFDKWSRCNEISKDTPIDEIVKILIEPNPTEE